MIDRHSACPYCSEPLPSHRVAEWPLAFSQALLHLQECTRRPDGNTREQAESIADRVSGFLEHAG